MGLNVKIGKGGHGYEVYDEEGKYAEEFSFSVEGQKIKGYDDFRALCFDSMVASGNAGPYTAEQLEKMYNDNEMGFKDNIDGALMEEYHAQLINAVNEYNQRTQVWDTPEEAAAHIHELFVPSLVQNLVDNDFANSASSSVADHYKVSTIAACLQMSRYKSNRAKTISQEEYDQEMKNNQASGGSTISGSNQKYLRQYILTAVKEGKTIPIIRDISGVDPKDRQNVFESFYDSNSPRHSCLAVYGCGYLGSVVYFATGGARYGSDYSYNLSIRGLVKLNDKLKLLECPVSDDWGAGRVKIRNAIPEIVKFKAAIENDKDFENRMLEVFKQNGNVDDNQAQKMVKRLKYEISEDTGLSAILMGYDAIYGVGYQFDLLNLNIADIVK